MSANTRLLFTLVSDEPVALQNRDQLVIGRDEATVTLADHADGAEAVADLIARMFTTLASAPDLTDEERMAVCRRMSEALDSVQPIAYAPTCFAMFDYEEDTNMGVLCTLPAGHTEPHKADDLPSATKIPYLPPDRDGETYWQRVEAEAESIGGAA